MKSIWKYIKKYFSPYESWGNVEELSGILLIGLKLIRHEINIPFIIHCGTQGNHAKNSYHYRGLAVDGHFQTELPIWIQYDILENTLDNLQLKNYTGIGVYPFWNNPGFHIDFRGYMARWGRIDYNNGTYVYTSVENCLEEAKRKSLKNWR